MMPVSEPPTGVRTPPVADFDQVAQILAERVRVAERAEQRRARNKPLRWPLLLIRLAMDGVLLNAAFVLAYVLRYNMALVRDVAPDFQRPLGELQSTQLLFTVIALAVFYARGVYAQPRGAGWLDQIGRLGSAALVAVCVLLVSSLVFSPTLPSRLFFVYLWLGVVVVFGVERYAMRQARQLLWNRGINEHRVLVVGATLPGQRVMRHILDRPDLGYRLIGYVDDRAQPRRWEVPFARQRHPQRLGGLQDIEQIIEDEHVDELLIALGVTRRTNLASLLEYCSARQIAYRLLPDLMEIRFDRCETESLDGIPLIGLREPVLRGGRLFVKRVWDIGLALVMLILTSPFILVIALAIRLEKPPGPVLFRQQRAGRGGRLFTCYKFRSMRPDAEQLQAQLFAYNEASGPIFKMKNDPRVTRVGRFLRRTSLDELPQLFNILRGEMSWVGPRPPTPNEVVNYSDWDLRRLEVTPGLTGLWQVSGRSDLAFEEMVTLDLYYVENWSLLLDCKVLLRTIPSVLWAHGAY